MVGREKHEIVAPSHLQVELAEQPGQLAVELQVARVDPRRAGAIHVGAHVGGRHAQGEHVGAVGSLAQLLAVDGGKGHVEAGRHAAPAAPQVAAQQGSVAAVETGHPRGQLLHVVGAGDKGRHALVIPVGGIGRMARGQDGSAVLERDAHHLALEVGGQSQLVAHGGHQQVAWRSPAQRAGSAHTGLAVVLHARHGFAPYVVAVAGDAARGWRGAGENG